MEKLVIIANSGRVRPLKYKPAGDDPQQQAHLFEIPGGRVEMRPESVSAVVTDQAGRYRQSDANARCGATSYGQENHLELELERHALARVAAVIDQTVKNEGNPPWRLVVPQPILAALTDHLAAPSRQALVEAVPGDWTKLPLAELEKRLLAESKEPW